MTPVEPDAGNAPRIFHPDPSFRSVRMRALRRLDDGAVALGLFVIAAARGVRDFTAFAFGVVLDMRSVLRHPAAFREQLVWIGVGSLPLVAFISVFTGAVAAWQAAHNFADYVPLRYVGSAVGKSVMLELGPVLTALVVAGRAGAAMAAELGTMAVTEQLDAFRALGLNPRRLLYAPRVLAAMAAL